jgi:DivIVA domain-containing protein
MALFILLGALVVGAIVFGVAALMTGADQGLEPNDLNASAVPLPSNRPLAESDFGTLRFDTGLRGYRMAQVDAALRRAAYDIGYKEELIAVLEAEVDALRSDRREEADALQRARAAALSPDAEAPADEPPDTADTEPPAAKLSLEKDAIAAATADADSDAPGGDESKVDEAAQPTAVGGRPGEPA